MSYDDPGFDSGFDLVDDGNVFYSVPTDHPAFRGPEDDEDDAGFLDRGITDFRGSDPFDASILELPVGRYDGVSRQGGNEPSDLPGTGDARQRAADRQFLQRQLEQRQREQGARSIREHAVAGEHRTSTQEGTGASGPRANTSLRDALAASLEQAGIQFLDEPSDDRTGIAQATTLSPEVLANGGPMKPRPQRTQPFTLPRASRGIVTPPKFQSATLTGMMGGLKSNVAGTWIVTLHIDSESYNEVMKLSLAHGLALDITVKRKSRD